MPNTPVFSFVATSRNDDHGGDVLQRTQTFIHRLAEQCMRHQLHGELILVEWNPPRSRASLIDVLAWPAGSEWFCAKHVVIPAEFHAELRYAARLPLFQMIAKNVGIRRAAGQYVIATNIDIIFSDELFERLKTGLLRHGVLYRSDRWDIPNNLQFEPDFDELLRRASHETIRYHMQDGTYVRDKDGFKNSTQNRFDEIFLIPLSNQLESLKTSLSQPDSVANRIDDILTTTLPQLRRRYLIPDLHLNGCGDFTMLAKPDWEALRGYPEWQIFSWNIDSVLLLQAHYNGIRIQELDHREVHYHIEHGHGSGWTPEGAESLWARLERLGIPSLSYEQFLEIVYELQDNAREGLFTLYNGSDWGFANRPLECNTVVYEGTVSRPANRVNEGRLAEDLATGSRTKVAEVRVENAIPLVDGVSVTPYHRQDGGLGVVVETLAECWSYAIGIDLSEINRRGEHWVNVSVLVEAGTVGIGLLSPDRRRIVGERYVSGPDEQSREISCFARAIEDFPVLLFRNAGKDDKSARFRVDCVYLYVEIAGETTLINVGSSNQIAEQAMDAPATGVRNSTTVPSKLKSCSPKALIRPLSVMPAIADDDELDCPIMIITPSEPGSQAAAMDLGFPGNADRDITVYAHIIEGEIGIGILNRLNNQIVLEHSCGPGKPLTSIKLQVGHVAETASLVIRNLSLTGASKLMVHGVEFHNRSSSDTV
jgi:hypothetical protein